MKTKNKIIAGLLAFGMGSVTNAAISLYAAWDLNEGSGTTTTQYQLGGGETWNQVTNPSASLAATASNTLGPAGASWGSASLAPNSTSSLTFSGASNTNELDTNVSGAGLGGTGSKTFVAWINPTAAEGSIISYTPKGGSTAGADLRFLVDSNGDLRGEVSSGSFEYDSTSLVDGGWVMVAAIFDGTTASNSSFYIGGTGIVSATSTLGTSIGTNASGTSGPDSHPTIVIGGDHADRDFTGGIDMVAIYNGAATETELNAIYTNGIAIPEPGTLVLVGIALGALLVFRRRR